MLTLCNTRKLDSSKINIDQFNINIFAGQFQLFDDSAIGFSQRRNLFGSYNEATEEPVFEYYNHAIPLYIHLLSDWSSCSLPVLPDTSLRVEIVLNSPDFYIRSRDPDAAQKNYRLSLTSAQLMLNTKMMNPTLMLQLEKKLAQKPVEYPLTRVDGKVFSIPQGLQTYTTDSLCFSAVNPSRVMMLMIPSYIWNANTKTNPYEAMLQFKDAHKRDIKLTRASLSINSVPLEVDTAGNHNQLVMQLFFQMYKHLGQDGARTDAGISLDAFKNGYGFLLYDLTAAGRATAGTEAVQPSKSGHLRLDLAFDLPLPYAVNLFVFSEYNASCTITKSRSVTYNYLAR